MITYSIDVHKYIMIGRQDLKRILAPLVVFHRAYYSYGSIFLICEYTYNDYELNIYSHSIVQTFHFLPIHYSLTIVLSN